MGLGLKSVGLSVIVPAYNEAENVVQLGDQLTRVLKTLSIEWEVIYVDDGSSDDTFKRLAAIAQETPGVFVVRLRRNYGQTAAISAGVDRARGDTVILLDADLQNDPQDIPRLLEQINAGYDVVSGWRKNRHDPWLTRVLPSKIANALISWVSGVHLHDYGCTLSAYRREVLEPVRLYGEMHRFIPAYAAWNGARITELPVEHHRRQAGRSKYGLGRTGRVLLDLITVKFLGTYTTKPMYAFGSIGGLMALAGFLSLVVAVIQKLVPPFVKLHNNPLTLLAAVLVIIAIQLILMGLLAELIVRTYYESQGRPTYLIREVVAADEAPGRPALPRVVSPRSIERES
jgi:glycosyltransferase involved in cell wall biosynthesis